MPVEYEQIVAHLKRLGDVTETADNIIVEPKTDSPEDRKEIAKLLLELIESNRFCDDHHKFMVPLTFAGCDGCTDSIAEDTDKQLGDDD